MWAKVDIYEVLCTSNVHIGFESGDGGGCELGFLDKFGADNGSSVYKNITKVKLIWILVTM